MAKFIKLHGLLINTDEVECVEILSEICEGGKHYEMKVCVYFKSGFSMNSPTQVVHEDHALGFIESMELLLIGQK